jgi:pilus assembly protein CpaF
MSDLPREAANGDAEVDEQSLNELFFGGETQSLHDRLSSQPSADPGASGGTSDPYAELKSRIHDACIARLGPLLFRSDMPERELTERVHEFVAEQMAHDKTPLAQRERQRLIREIANDILGYGPIEPLLHDETVSEIMVNGFDRVYVERGGKLEPAPVAFVDEAHLMRIIDKIVSMVGRRIDEASPMVDARLPDGSRINAIIPPLALGGPTLTIRKFARDALTMDDLVRLGSVSETAADFLAHCVRGKLNIVVSGGSGAGKTTLLNNLSTFVPGDERIITIEDAAELRLKQPHVVRLESRPPNIEGEGQVRIRELVLNALRMRPDRIIVGEVRGAEAVDMLQAMNTGHDGSLTTVHANSPRDALHRLETLVLTAGVDMPLTAVREQISGAFDLLIHVTRLVDGSRRITHITEVLRMEAEVVTLQDLFVAKPPQGDQLDVIPERRTLLEPLRCTGLKPHFYEKLSANGVTLPTELFQFDGDGMELEPVLAGRSRQR